ncbi:hypothetical protein F3157_18365 [Virgibacillus dakarensis]|nr:hypothetical protein [Virgibacillus dakarensis]
MEISYDGGQLITINLVIIYHDKSLQIDDVIADTGSSHTVISPDVLEEIDVKYETGDKVYKAYGIGGTVPFYVKTIDQIKIGTLNLKHIDIDVGVLPNNHNGLLGLDILKENNLLIDLKNLELYQSKE